MITMVREVKLLKKCLRGNRQAFEAIVAKYQELVCAITFSGTADIQQSEELAHQTFINAWKNLYQLNDLAKFRPWLCTIARNNVRDFFNKRQRDIIAKAKPMENIKDAASDEPGPLESAVKKEHEELVSNAIKRIPERYREPLVLYYRQEKSIKQVARLLDLSEGVVKQRLQRGRKMIKEQISSIVEETLSATGPKKAFTTAVIASIAGIAIKGSGVAAAAGVAAGTSTTGATASVATLMSGVTAKIITAAAVAAIGVGSIVVYKHVTTPSPQPEFSQAGIVVQEEEKSADEKVVEEATEQYSDKRADLLAVEEPESDLKNDGLIAESPIPAADSNTINFGIHVFDEETDKPIAGAKLRVNPGCGCNCEPDYYWTDDNGFYLIDFGEKKPTYLSILVTKTGHVPMMFAWRDKMVENLGKEFSFYLPKGKKIGGVIENKDAKPISSATVIIDMPSDEGREYPWMRFSDYTVTTDPNGRWKCDIFPDEPRRFSVRLRHPDYADTRVWVNERKYKFEDFYNMQSVLVMKDGALLSGWVISAEDMPVEGAFVFTCEDRFDNDAPKTTTDSEGYFEFPHFLPHLQNEKVVLTIKAKGYGPALEVIGVRPDMEPVLITLDQPYTIRVQVVDVNGNPVSGAGVDVDDWRGYRSLSWRSKTDETGRFVWNEAPEDEVNIDIYKSGYMRVANKMFVALDEEYEITMLPSLVISGSVVDADTNEPIQDFTASPGIQWNSGSIHWETDSFNTKDFTDGKYELTISSPYPGHMVRIDSEDYLLAKSRVFGSNEGSVTYDFRLEKGTGPSGIVYDPNGLPATGAQIYVVMQNKYLHFENGKPSNRPEDSDWAVTDEDGTFSFKDFLDDSLYKLVVMHEEGFAEVIKQQWPADPNITLQKWGRVKGTLYSGLGTAANQGVHFYSVDTQNNPEKMNYAYTINAITDDKGNFVMERAMPGRAGVARRIVSNFGRRISYSATENIEVNSNETTYVEIGGGGRPVTGRLIKPEWATDTVELSMVHPRINPAQKQKMNPYEIYAGMEFPRPANFDSMTVAEILKWYEQWMTSDEGEALREEVEKRARDMYIDQRNFNVMVESDGSFKIVDVRPGQYVLSGELRKADKRGWANYKEPIVAEIKHKFDVGDITEENQDIRVELGTVEFSHAAKLEPNRPVTDFSVRLLNDGTLNLADLRGKYVLLTFYLITAQESLNDDMANLKRIQDDFSDDERFVMVGLAHGGMTFVEELTKKFLVENSLTWQQGILDGSNYDLMETFKIRTWPHSLLISPDGVLLADGLKGEKLYEAVVKTLSK